MKRASSFHAGLVILAACCPPETAKKIEAPVPPAPAAGKSLGLPEETHLANVRQLTFGGNNAEAYWAFGGDRLILQSDRAPYKCDQIEVLSTKGGAPQLVSTGKGRTTCAYFLKGDKEIVYASTHEASPECPTPPDHSHGYVWGLFEFDIYKANADGSGLVNLTPNTPGYDAEATVCPKDGSIIFTSIRTGDLELFRMDADGKNVRQLTNQLGYDGGAFFSNDCSKIVWRSSRPQGKDADEYNALLAQKIVKPGKMDLYVANADGSDARQVTYLPGASFAPYFFPNGKRIIFSSNYKNPRSAEFDLFAVDIDGTNLEQITFSGGFDGFPVFSPDGKTLSFSSNRRDVVTKDGKEVYRVSGTPVGKRDTNVFLADWVDGPVATAAPETREADEIAADVAWLADDAREGRGIGTKGLEASLSYFADKLEAAGIAPAEGTTGYMQPFEVTTEVKRGAATAFEIDGKAIAAEDFTPIAASSKGSVKAAVVAVGYGIVDAEKQLDDYKGKNVRGKIVLVHRFAPSTVEGRDAARLGDLRQKAFVAKSKGAIGMIVVDDGEASVKPPVPAGRPPAPGKPGEKAGPAPGDAGKPAPKAPAAPAAPPTAEEAPLPKLGIAEQQAGIPVVVATRKAAGGLRKGPHTAKLVVEIEPVRTKTANVVGVIRARSKQPLTGVVVIGAHIDHLGMGGPSALDPNVHAVHNGADDNASGVAALLAAARELEAKQSELRRDVYIVAFSAEEMGALGSDHYVKHPPTKQPIVAMLNLDMVGRMKMNKLHVNGGDSAKEWKEIVGPVCDAARVDCTIGGSGYGPSDHMPFYIAGAPVLFFFTGSHREYHTAIDDTEKLNAIGAARVATIAANAALDVANRPTTLTYVKSAPENVMGGDVRRRGASLGTVPSYSDDPSAAKGVVLADVVPDGAAAKAGLKAGDRIVQIGQAEIANAADLMFVLTNGKPGQQVQITFVRDGKTQTVTATYGTPRGRR